MKIFAIADLHLALNENINKPMDIFGPGWENHDVRLKKSWEELVSPNDMVLIPGDVSWGLKLDEAMVDLEWIDSLPGKKVLIKGNHDLWWSKVKYLNSHFDDMFFLKTNCYLIESESIAVCGTKGWIMPEDEGFDEHDKKIYKRELLRLELSLKMGKETGARDIIVMTHYPPATKESPCTEMTNLLEKYGVRLCVYGHLHGAGVFGRGIKGNHRGVEYKLVSLDYLGAKPLLLYDNGRFV